MAGYTSGRASSASLFSRLVESVRRVLEWRPGRYEVADDPEAVAPGPYAPAEPEPEHIHHSRYSNDELDAAIENSLRTGDADLDAALRRGGSGDFDPSKPGWARTRSKSRSAEAQPAPTAFGGDLYPTSAHTTGADVRYVKVSTWSSKQSPAAGPAGT